MTATLSNTIEIPLTLEGLETAGRWLQSLATKHGGEPQIVPEKRGERTCWRVQFRHDAGYFETLAEDEEIQVAIAEAIKRLMRRAA